MARSYRELTVWQKSMVLARSVYRLSREWPKEEMFGLTSQSRRSAVSIASNIAEGEGRGSDADFVRFLNMAHGSLCELETQLLLSSQLALSAEADVDALLAGCGEVGRLIHGLRRSLRPDDRRLTTKD